MYIFVDYLVYSDAETYSVGLQGKRQCPVFRWFLQSPYGCKLSHRANEIKNRGNRAELHLPPCGEKRNERNEKGETEYVGNHEFHVI